MPWPVSDHCNGTKFFNLDGEGPQGFAALLRWQFTKHASQWPKHLADVVPAQPGQRVNGNALRVTFVNHATVLLQTCGINILTDPIWSERASPFRWTGPRRHRIPGVAWDDLPPIDLALLSHNHYDHCDLPTLRRLQEKHRPQVLTTLGLAGFVPGQAIELDWWASYQVRPGVRIISVPAKHFSARGLLDRNRTLWCGFIIETPSRVVYFAGDTAFGQHFAVIRERFGAPDLALLPIGAYEPRWFMSRVHMSPEEAVDAHQVLGSRLSLGIHFGTFAMADESEQDPVFRLRAAMGKQQGQPPFLTIRNGEAVDVPE